jgi:hypothetical protein
MAALTEDQLKNITDQEMRSALGGYNSGKLSNQRKKALSYYLGLPDGDLAPPEIDGRSTFVDTTIRNQIEWMVPSLMKTFCSGESVVEFSPTKEGDEEKAKLATDYINYIFFKKNEGYTVLQTAIRDALLQKAGVIKVWWDNREEQTREEYKALSEIDLAMLMQDEEIEPIEQEAYPDEEDVKQREAAIEQLTARLQQATLAAQQGDPQAMQAVEQITQQLMQIEQTPPKMLYNVTFKRTKKAGKVCIENVPPEEFLISAKAKNIRDTPFVAHRVLRTLSDLTAMGYKNVDKLSSGGEDGSYNTEFVERQSFDDDSINTNDEDYSADPSMRSVWVTECYLRADYNGDGIAEWRKVVRAGNEILENEECDGAPFAALIPIILPHRFFGLSIADLGMEPQKLQTQLVRSVLDNQFLQVNGRYYAVDGQVNLDDLLHSQPGGVVRIKSPGAVGRLDQGIGNTGDSMQMLEWTQDYTENATGWTRRSQGTGPSGLQQQTATGMNIITNRDDMRLDLIARNFAEGGITDLFKLMLKLVCQYQDKKEAIAISGSWVQIDPREWRNQFSLNVNVGLGTNNKEQQANHIMNLLQIQERGLAIGITNPEKIYNACELYAQAMGQKSPDKFFVNPKDAPPAPPQPDPEMIKLQGQMQLEDKKMQMDVQKHQAEQVIREKELAQEAQARMQELELEAQKQAQQAQLDMQERQHKAELDAQLEVQRMEFEWRKAQLDNETKIIVASMSKQGEEGGSTNEALSIAMQGFTEALGRLGAPRTIIRDETGRAQGIA